MMMPILERRSTIPHSKESVESWYSSPAALRRMIPTWRKATIEKDDSPRSAGKKIALRVNKMTGVWHWEYDFEHPSESPEAESHAAGPFSEMQHRQGKNSISVASDTSCVLSDRLDFDYPLGFLGERFFGRGVRDELEAVLHARQIRLSEDLSRHLGDGPGRPLRIGVTGSSGLVGSALANFLTCSGHQVVRFVRGGHSIPGNDQVRWDPSRGTIDTDRMEGLDAMVHLAGAGIANERWSVARRRMIRSSRVGGTMLLCSALAALKDPPKVLVSASAIGYYGNTNEPVDETSAPGRGFLPDLCVEWEAVTSTAQNAGIRVVIPRIGVVLSPKGGALEKMLTPARMGMIGPVGSGEQGMSCIGLDDLVYLIHKVIGDESFSGPINAVAPDAVSQKDFAQILGGILGRPSVVPMPAKVVKMLFGEMGEKLLLEGNYVRPERIRELGFRFSQPTIEEVLRLQLGRFISA